MTKTQVSTGDRDARREATMKDYHKKPTKKQRSVQDAINRAARLANDLPKIVQVYASDWDLVILADEVARLQEYEWKYKDLCK